MSPYQNIWLSFACLFFGGVCVGAGIFARRQAANGQRFLDRIDKDALNAMLGFGGILGFFLLIMLGGAVYNLINREMDIHAAKAGISTPTTTPTPVPTKVPQT